MESFLTLIVVLIFLPIVGGTALGLMATVWQVATAASTPKWQQYLWFLGAGYVLLHLETFLRAVTSYAEQW